MEMKLSQRVVLENGISPLGAPMHLVARDAGLEIAGSGTREVAAAFAVIFPPYKSLPQSGTWFKTEAEARARFHAINQAKTK